MKHLQNIQGVYFLLSHPVHSQALV